MNDTPLSAPAPPAQAFRIVTAPPFPSTNQWRDILRWLVCVMDDDDPGLGFAASLLHHARDHGGLSEKQAVHASRLVDAYHARWRLGDLECQKP